MATTTPTRRRPPPRPRRAPAHKRAKKTRRSWLWRYRRVLFLLAFLVATAGAGVLFVLFQAPLPPAPSLASLKQTTFLTDANGQRLATFHGAENRTVVTLDKVPPIVRQAVVAVEDRNFYEHSGVDPIGITRALITDLRHRDVKQGGSTITQQYVKNTYVGRERSAWRKIREAVISVKLERQLTKDEILARSLNTIYFGRGAYAVQAAAQAYFGRDVSALGPAGGDESRAEISRIMASALASGGLTSENRAYLAQVIVQRTGLPQSEAERRIDAAVNAAREAADKARKAAILTGFVTAAGLILSLGAAWWAAMKGGQRRDNSVPPRFAFATRVRTTP
jgi:hypothetical protein